MLCRFVEFNIKAELRDSLSDIYRHSFYQRIKQPLVALFVGTLTWSLMNSELFRGFSLIPIPAST